MTVEEASVTRVGIVIVERVLQLTRLYENNKLLGDLLLIVISIFKSPRK